MDKGIVGHIRSAVIVAAIAVASIASCKTNAGLVTPNPPVVTDQSDCAAACSTLKGLGCKEGNPIDMGTTCKFDSDCKGPDGNWDHSQACAANGACMVTCANFCTSTENQGVWLDPTCVKSITSCSQIDSCPAPAPKQPVNSCEGPACALPGNH